MKPIPTAKNRRKERDDLRLTDLRVFLDIFAKAQEERAESFNQLFATLGEKWVTANIGRLGRVTKFLFLGQEALKPADKGHGFGVLFTPRHREGLKPTQVAEKLYKDFQEIYRRCIHARERFQTTLACNHERRTVVRLGAPQTAAYRLLAFAFSNNKDIFGKDVEVRVEVDGSEELVRKLEAGGILDAVIAYGKVDEDQFTRKQLPARRHQDQPEVYFRPFEHEFGMIMVCHPGRKLLAKPQDGTQERKNHNEGYWDEMAGWHPAHPVYKEKRKSKPRPEANEQASSPTGWLYHKLREVDPLEIDYKETPLIVVPSYGQAPGVERLIKEVRRDSGVRVVTSFEESLALVRAYQGVAIANEFYCTRENVTAFRLTPIEDFQRQLGVYYTLKGLSEPTLRVVRFVREYVGRFGHYLRTSGKLPAYGDKEYGDFCDEYATGKAVAKGWESVEAFRNRPSRKDDASEAPA
jgi:DNA-binding transcriptional LysR family regulator